MQKELLQIEFESKNDSNHYFFSNFVCTVIDGFDKRMLS